MSTGQSTASHSVFSRRGIGAVNLWCEMSFHVTFGSMTASWQATFIEHASSFLQALDVVRTVFLKGSFVDQKVATDYWSDVDLVIAVSDHALVEFSESRTWLQGLGTIVGIDRNFPTDCRGIRVCFDGLRRADFVIVSDALLQSQDKFTSICGASLKKLFQKDNPVSTAARQIHETRAPSDDITTLADAFWFKAALSVSKIMRNDLLVGLHLALDLQRDCLVLQMIRRDRALGTNIHRFGGYGNEIATALSTAPNHYSPSEILTMIARSFDIFDNLAPMLSKHYSPRFSLICDAMRCAQDELKANS
jgi:hypothetical protein